MHRSSRRIGNVRVLDILLSPRQRRWPLPSRIVVCFHEELAQSDRGTNPCMQAAWVRAGCRQEWRASGSPPRPIVARVSFHAELQYGYREGLEARLEPVAGETHHHYLRTAQANRLALMARSSGAWTFLSSAVGWRVQLCS
ncbi:hypothetical protein MRX96_032177 [Rhipicephalus microplus]